MPKLEEQNRHYEAIKAAAEAIGIRVDPESQNPWNDFFTARMNNTALVNPEDGAHGIFNLFDPYNQTHQFSEATKNIPVDYFKAFLTFLSQSENTYGDVFPYTGLVVGDTDEYEKTFGPATEVGNTIQYLNALATYLEKEPKQYFPFSTLQLILPSLNDEQQKQLEELVVRVFKALANHPEVTALHLYENHIQRNINSNVAVYTPSDTLVENLLDELKKPEMKDFACMLHGVKSTEKTTPLQNELSKRRRAKESAQLKTAREKLEAEMQPKPSVKKSGWSMGAAKKASASQAPAEIQRPVVLVLETEVATEVAVSQEAAEKHVDRSQLLGREMMISEFCKAHSPCRKILIESAMTQNLLNFPDGIAEGIKDKVESSIAQTYADWANNLWNQLLGAKKLSGTIQSISPEAFLKLCSAPQFLTSGIDVNALPPGFYIEADALWYNSTLESKHKKQNPLVRDWKPKAAFEPWVGDAHQFTRNPVDAFNQLFQGLNQDTKNLEPQLCFGFFKTLVNDLYSPDKLPEKIDDFLDAYFRKEYGESTEPMVGRFANISQLFILANLTYRFGKEGLTYFIENLNALKKHPSLLHSFLQYGFGGDIKYLENNNSVFALNCQPALTGAIATWSTPDALLTMRKLTQFNQNEQIWWKRILKAEFNSVGYVDIVSIYKGFRYFLDEINKMGLVLPEDCPIYGSGSLTQLNRMLCLLKAVPEMHRQDQFLNVVTKDIGLQELQNCADTISKSIDFAKFSINNRNKLKSFIARATTQLDQFIDDPILAAWIASDDKHNDELISNQIVYDYFIALKNVISEKKRSLPLTEDGALYAVQKDNFIITHPAMELSPTKLLPNKNTYLVSFEELKNACSVIPGAAPAAKAGESEISLSVLCHRFLGSCARELAGTYQMYVEFIDSLMEKPSEIVNALTPMLMMTITGRRGAKAFEAKKLDVFLSQCKKNNEKKYIEIISTLNKHPHFLALIQSNLNAPTLDELLGLINIILQSEARNEEAINDTIDRLIGINGSPSDAMMQSWAVWNKNRAHIDAKNFIEFSDLIMTSEYDHVKNNAGEWCSILALLQNQEINQESLEAFFNEIPASIKSSSSFSSLLSLLATVDTNSLDNKQFDLKTLGEIFNKVNETITPSQRAAASPRQLPKKEDPNKPSARAARDDDEEISDDDAEKAQAASSFAPVETGITITILKNSIQTVFPKCKFIEPITGMRPPLAVKIERDYWGDLSYINELLKVLGKINPDLDSFENIEAREHDQPTIVQLYRFALRIKKNKKEIIDASKQLDENTKLQLDVEHLILALQGEGAAALFGKGIQGMFAQLLENMFKNKLELIANAFPKDPKKSDKSLPAFEALKKYFPQPTFPKIEITEKIDEKKSSQQEITLAQYQADCQSIEKLYNSALALYQKWPMQFNLDAILKNTAKCKPPITAFQLGTIFSAIQGIDVPHLPPELFDLFSKSNFAALSQTVSDVLVFKHISLLDKIKIIDGVLKTPENAAAIYHLPTLLDTYKHNSAICTDTSELFFKLIDRADIGALFNGVTTLLKHASCDDVREKILANFSSDKANIDDLCALIDIVNKIPSDADKKNYLNIIAYGILDGDYTAASELDVSEPGTPASQNPEPNTFAGNESYAQKLAGKIKELAPYYQSENSVRPGFEQLKAALDEQDHNAWFLKAASDPDKNRNKHIETSEEYVQNNLFDRVKQFKLINHENSGNDYLSSFYLQTLYNSVLVVDALRFGADDSEPKKEIKLISSLLSDDKKINKSLSSLSNGEISTLSTAYREFFSNDLSDKNPDEVWVMRCEFLSLACEAMYRTTKRWPNEMQIMSVLTHMLSGGNMISEIPTGAGKSIINNLLASIQWANGYQVDVCTSNMELAIRDHHNHARFYELLGAKSVRIDANSTAQDYGAGDIHFSDVSQMSLYRQKMRIEHLDAKKEKRALILDEADTQLLTYSPSKQVSRKSKSAGMEENPHETLFNEILIYTADEPFKLLKQFTKEHVKLFRDALEKSSAAFEAKRSSKVINDDDLLEYLNASLTAQALKKDKDYIIQSKLETVAKKAIGLSRAVIIDSEETPQTKPRFGKHVHQFLHAHLNQRMKTDSDFSASCDNYPFVYEPAGMRSSSETVRQFVRGYELLWGNTGTLGGRNEADRLQSVYHATAVQCPSYWENKLLKQKSICVTDDQHLESILQLINDNKSQRPLLLFCKDMTQARALEKYLLEHVKKEKLQLHDAQAELIGQKASRVLDRAGADGMITITTSILGRGADFHTKHDDGFHAVITSSDLESKSVRQMAGRAGRKGHPGSWQFLVKESELNFKENAALTPALIDDAITEKQKELAEKSDAHLKTEEQYADILHQYWEDFLLLSRTLKDQVPPPLWQQCHIQTLEKLGAFFQAVERQYDELRDQEEAFELLVAFANPVWENTVKEIDKAVKIAIDDHYRKQGAAPAALAAPEQIIKAIQVASMPRELTKPKATELAYVKEADIRKTMIAEAVIALPRMSDQVKLYNANDRLKNRLMQINARLKQLGMDSKILTEGETVDALVDKYIKYLLEKYIAILNTKNIYSAPVQGALIELRAQFINLLAAVKEYPKDLVEEKKTIIEKLHGAISNIKEANEKASPHVKLSIARFDIQAKRSAIIPAQAGAAAAAKAGGNPHWEAVKEYAEKELKKYRDESWFYVAKDRKTLVDNLLKDQSGLYSINSCGPRKTNAYPGKSAVTESGALQKLLQRILDNQKAIVEEDAKVDKSRFFSGYRNITGSRLMNTLNDITAFIVQEQLKMAEEQEPAASPSKKEDSITQNLKSIVTVIVNRQNELRAKNQLPPGYQIIEKIAGQDEQALSIEKLIHLRATMLNNIDAFYSHHKYDSFLSSQSAFVNLLKPMSAQLDILIAQHEKTRSPENAVLHEQLMQTYQRIFSQRNNAFNTSVLIGVLNQKEIPLPNRIENTNRVMELLSQGQSEYRKNEDNIVKLAVMLCRLQSKVKESAAYATGRYSEIENWANQVKEIYIEGKANDKFEKNFIPTSFQASVREIKKALEKPQPAAHPAPGPSH